MNRTEFTPWRSCLLALGLVLNGAAAAGWQQDWEETGPVLDADAYDGTQTFAANDGAALLSFFDGYDYSFAHLRADGSLGWRLSMPLVEWYPFDAAFEPDGSAVLMFTGISTGGLARVDPAGAVQWSVGVQGSRFAVTGTSVLAALPLGSDALVTAIDKASGRVRWQTRVPGHGSGAGAQTPVVADASGNAYVTLATDFANNRRLAKLDAQGNIVWNQPVVVPQSQVQMLAVRGSNVYLWASMELQAYAVADGALQWRSANCNASNRGIPFVGNDPLCQSAQEVRRLAAANGGAAWSHATGAGAGYIVGVYGFDVYYSTGLNGNSTWERWAGHNGVTQWQAPLPYSDIGRTWQLSSGLLGIVGAGELPGTAALHRYRFDNGSLFDTRTLPEVQRGVKATGSLYDGADAFVRTRASWKAQPTRLRRLAADSGNVIWENAASGRDNLASMAVTPDSVLLAEHTYDPEARVRSLDRSSGAQRWEKAIAGYYDNYWINKPPQIAGLANDDAIVSYGYAKYYGGSQYRHLQEVQRLRADTGQLVWKKELAGILSPDPGYQWLEPPLLRVDQDVLLWPGGDGIGSTIGLQRLDGASGNPLFWDGTAEDASLARVSVAGDAVFGVVPGFGSQPLRLTKRSASSGQLLWQVDYPNPPGHYLRVQDLLPLADGDVMVLGYAVKTGLSRSLSARLLRVKSDGSGLRYVVRGLPSTQLLQDWIGRIVLGGAGEALLHRRIYDGRRGMNFVQRFDLAQGRVVGSQALNPQGLNPFFPRTHWDASFQPRGDALLLSGVAYRAPLPSTRRDALLDIGVTRHGDLALQLSAFPASYAVGDTLPFTAGVSYSGDGDIVDATLLLDLPWQGSESELVCAGPGISRCELDTRHGQIVARFDAAPGAQLSLSGRVRALAAPSAETLVVRGLVYAPLHLLESDFLNNFQSIAADGTIFADGFD